MGWWRFFVAAAVAVVAVIVGAFAVNQGLDPNHLSDEPFSWPSDLVYSKVRVSEQLSLSVVQAGPATAEHAILFIHGFPETAYSWKDYLTYYAAKGYHVIAPDTRYVNRSQPVNVSSELTIDVLAEDMAQLLRAVQRTNVIVISHDWGSAIACALVLRHPSLVKAWVSFSVPHADLYRSHNLRNLPLSLGHNWYFFFWGLGGNLALDKSRRSGYSFLKWFGFGSSIPKAYSKHEIAHYQTAWDLSDDQLFSYYKMGARMLLGGFSPAARPLQPSIWASLWVDSFAVQRPSLLIFGTRDAYVDPAMARKALSDQWINNENKKVVLLDATHWVAKEKAVEAKWEIDSFLSRLSG